MTRPFHLDDFKKLTARVLRAMGPRYSSADAQALVVRTHVYESNLYHLRQWGGGPARGFAQIEMTTALDILGRYLARSSKAELRERIAMILGYDPVELAGNIEMLDLQLQGNLILGIIICRLKYGMIPSPLPAENERMAQGRYYKTFYNTSGGKGGAMEFAKMAGELGI